MNNSAINWDEIPDIITKDQLYRICHISKSTAKAERYPAITLASRHAAIKSKRKM